MFDGDPTSNRDFLNQKQTNICTCCHFQFPDFEVLSAPLCTAKQRQKKKNLPFSSPVCFPTFPNVNLLFADPALIQ